MKHLATVVARKDPAEWTDDDAERFEKIQLPDVCGRFRRTVSLHSKTLTKDALNVVLTRPDGSEDYRVIATSIEQREAAGKAVNEAAKALNALYGSRSQALDGLLEAIANDLLPPSND
jgi:hypothetical protein